MPADLVDDLTHGVLASLAYGGVGATVLAGGYAVLDMLTPGSLRHLVYAQRNRGAAILATAHLAALATVITTAILTSGDSLRTGVLDSAVYGLLGVVLLAVAFKVLDALTPGQLGSLMMEEPTHPAVWVTSAFQLGLGAVLAAAIS
ncbi:MAG: DUF350 domain-containing protein [Mycobacteriales bacterium]